MTESGLERQIESFVSDLVQKAGFTLAVTTERMDDGVRIDLAGDDTEPLLRRKGEGLDALQHVVNAVFRDALPGQQRIVVDCAGFRRARDRELQQIARFLMDKVRTTGMAQEMGPLNSYARRLVHLEVASAPDLASESQGDGSVKTVIISRRP